MGLWVPNTDKRKEELARGRGEEGHGMVKRQNELWSELMELRAGVWNKWAEWAVPSSVETEGKRLLNLQGHCSPRKAVPLETVLYWEERGAEEREGRGGAFIFSSCSESLLISDLKSSACMSVLVEVTWDSSSHRPFLQNTKGEESPSTSR